MNQSTKNKAVAIGVSAGGLAALNKIIALVC